MYRRFSLSKRYIAYYDSLYLYKKNLAYNCIFYEKKITFDNINSIKIIVYSKILLFYKIIIFYYILLFWKKIIYNSKEINKNKIIHIIENYRKNILISKYYIYYKKFFKKNKWN